MKKFEVKAITEKVELLEVNGQVTTYGCLNDCKRYKWTGNKNSYTQGCYKKPYYDAFLSPNK